MGLSTGARRAGRAGRAGRRRSGQDRLIWSIGGSAVALVAAYIAVPLIALIAWTVTHDAWTALSSPVALDALLLSARTTGATMAILIVVGTPAAYFLGRVDFPGARVVNTLIDLPVALPPSAAGIALLLAFGRQGLIGTHLNAAGITLSFTTAAVIMAELFVAAPFYLRLVATGFARVDREIEDAAMVDGAGPGAVFRRITVPQAAPAIIAGALTAWARAFGEFGATIIFAGNFQGVTQTLPLAVYSVFQDELDAAVALAVLALGFAFTVLLATRYLAAATTRPGRR